MEQPRPLPLAPHGRRSRAGDSDDSTAYFIKCRRRAVCGMQPIRRWWTLTTDRTFLVSPLSRRSFWKSYPYVACSTTVLWYTMLATGAFVDNSIGPVLAETMLEVSLISLSGPLLPTASVLSDLALVSVWGPFFWRHCKNLPPDSAFGHELLPSLIYLMWSIGLHSFFILLFCLFSATSLLADPRMATSDKASLIWWTLFAVLVVWLLEWQTASHFHKLQKLMKVSTDGQLVVNRNTGTIVTANVGTSRLLGRELAGEPFSCIFDSDDWKNVENRCSALRGEPEEAFLATLTCKPRLSSAPTHEFEARLIPYEVSGHQVHLCLQLVGEVRATGKENDTVSKASHQSNMTGKEHDAISKSSGQSHPQADKDNVDKEHDSRSKCSAESRLRPEDDRDSSIGWSELGSRHVPEGHACASLALSKSSVSESSKGTRLTPPPMHNQFREACIQTDLVGVTTTLAEADGVVFRTQPQSPTKILVDRGTDTCHLQEHRRPPRVPGQSRYSVAAAVATRTTSRERDINGRRHEPIANRRPEPMACNTAFDPEFDPDAGTGGSQYQDDSAKKGLQHTRIHMRQSWCPIRLSPGVFCKPASTHCCQDTVWQVVCTMAGLTSVLCSTHDLTIADASKAACALWGSAKLRSGSILSLVNGSSRVHWLRRSFQVSQDTLTNASDFRIMELGADEFVAKDGRVFDAIVMAAHLPPEPAHGRPAAWLVVFQLS